jgi:hypothetical protein
MKTWSDRSRCRGTVYVVVLGAAMIIAVIGLSSLLAARVIHQASASTNDYVESRLIAQSGLNVGLQLIAGNANWRNDYADGTLAVDQPLGRGWFSVELSDPTDGDLADSADDPVTAVSIGVKGESRHMFQVQLQPRRTAYDALSSALHCDQVVDVKSGATFHAINGPLTSNGDLDNNGTTIGDVAAITIQDDGSISGTREVATALRSSPGAAAVSYYRSVAVPRDFGSQLSNRVVAPQAWEDINDTYGIVYHDSLGSNMTISNVRIYGTLLITTHGKNLSIGENVFIEPIRRGQPALIIDGDVIIEFEGGANLLSEAQVGVNFNPSRAPYQRVSDYDTADLYPSEIRGLIHVTGDLILRSTSRIVGAVVCNGKVEIDDTPYVIHDPAIVQDPGPGYSTITGMEVVGDSWQQTVMAGP